MNLMVLTGDADMMTNVTNSLVNSLTDIGSKMGTMVSSVLPIAVPIMGAVLLVGFGIKLFKKFTKN